MSERPNRATICSVVLLDLLDQSSKPVVMQIRDKELLNHVVDDAIQDVAQHDRVLVDRGDSSAVVLFGPPEAALFIAMMIRDGIVKRNMLAADKLLVRAGIGIGPVRVEDTNGLPTIQGEGVNAAERVKNLAAPNQILVSRAYYDITSGLTDEIAGMFRASPGQHEAYAVRSPQDEPFVPESAAELTDDAPLFSRLLHDENSPRYGLWSSIALVAMVMLVGGFMVFSSLLRPDLGVVIADTKPAAPVADLHAVSASGPTAQPVIPETQDAASDFPEPTETESTISVAAQLEAEQSTAAQTDMPAAVPRAAKERRTATRSAVTQTAATQPALTEDSADIGMDVSEGDTVADFEEIMPEEQVVVPQEETKKVAAATTSRRGPAVEERRLPSGGRHKTVWDAFRESFKQGSEEQVCTQAEIALNRCK